MNKEKNFVSAVIYVHNDGKTIEDFLGAVIAEFEANFEHSEIICVNDSSTDDSTLKIKQASKSAGTASVSVVHMSYFQGLELAMNAGVDLAIGDFVFEFDMALQDFERKEIMNVYRRALQGYDIVSAVPDKKERLASRMFYKLFDRFSNLSYKMRTERFRILSRRVINRIGTMHKTIPYRKAIYASQGLKTDAVIYAVVGTGQNRRDKKEKRYRFGIAVDSLILFTETGYYFSMAMTLLMMLVSVFMLVYSVVVFATANPVAGWTTTILFLSVAFFGLFGILTIIIKYLQLLVNLVFKKRNYCFESIEKLTK